MGWPAKDYKRATVYYLDNDERQVNVASPGGAISTSEFNVRAMSPARYPRTTGPRR